MSNHRDYVLAVQAPARQTGDGTFVTESAFAGHLKAMRAALGSRFDRIVLVAPEITTERYEQNPAIFGELCESRDGIAFVPAFSEATTRSDFWLREVVSLWRKMGKVMSSAGCAHSGLAEDIWRPYLVLLNARAWLSKVPIVFIVDIDFRKMSDRFYQTGVWSLKSYVVNRLIHDPFKRLQVWLAVRTSALALLKSPSMVESYGAGRSNVKDFLDAAHSFADVISNEDLENRLATRRDQDIPLEVVYFGRFVEYKGLDYTLDAIRIVRKRGADVRLTLIGGGGGLETLQEKARSKGLENAVTFIPQVQYGAELFELIDRADIAIASPKVEDTPRAALDAMARGLPIVAFDIDYFRNLSEKSGAVALAPWPSPEGLADQLFELHKMRANISRMSRNAVAFARSNTQERWLEQRIRWTVEACSDFRRM